MKEFWNERYSSKESAFGLEPNEYFKDQISKFKPGEILLPAEGEGRNAVFAAKLGWKVTAFDMSIQGKYKAEKLAKNHSVSIDYKVGEFSEIQLEENQFDAIGLIYAHFPAQLKSKYHNVLDTSLRAGGIIILEAFSKSHLQFNKQNPKVGGPKDIDMLYSIEEIKRDFENYEIFELEEKEVILSEGLYHNGLSSVIRFVGRKQ